MKARADEEHVEVGCIVHGDCEVHRGFKPSLPFPVICGWLSNVFVDSVANLAWQAEELCAG